MVALSDGLNGGWLLNSARATVAGPCLGVVTWPSPPVSGVPMVESRFA